RAPQWNRDQTQRNPSSAIKPRLPFSVHHPPRIPRIAYCVIVPNSGVTGALLLFHFQPIFGDCPPAAPNTTYVPAATCNSAFNSVSSINNQVNWGFLIRNIHYQASNAMVLLAVMHMFYQYFAGRYKLRYE